MLATTIKDHQGSWEDHIHATCMAYNTSIQQTTGYTPFFLMFARQPRNPVDLMFNPDALDTVLFPIISMLHWSKALLKKPTAVQESVRR